MFYDQISAVFASGNPVTAPHTELANLKRGALFQLAIEPHKFDKSGQVASVLVTVSDVTALVRQTEASHLIEMLELVMVERNKADLYLDLLTHNMANRLQAMMTVSELLTFEKEKEQTDALVNFLMTQIDEAIELIREAKQLAKVTETEGTTKSINLHEVIEHAITAAETKFPDKSIRIGVSVPEDLAVCGDPLLEVCFTVLFNQCIKTQQVPDPKISVSAKYQSNQFVELFITGFGMEIPSSMRDMVFERGVQKLVPQAGAGLSLVKEVIERNGGEIRLEEIVERKGKKELGFAIRIPQIGSTKERNYSLPEH